MTMSPTRRPMVSHFNICPTAKTRSVTDNGQVRSIYRSKVAENMKNDSFERSKAHCDALRSFISIFSPAYLPNSGFVGRDKPGEDDFHVAAWLARIASVSGTKTEELNELGKEVRVLILKKWGSNGKRWVRGTAERRSIKTWTSADMTAVHHGAL